MIASFLWADGVVNRLAAPPPLPPIFQDPRGLWDVRQLQDLLDARALFGCAGQGCKVAQPPIESTTARRTLLESRSENARLCFLIYCYSILITALFFWCFSGVYIPIPFSRIYFSIVVAGLGPPRCSAVTTPALSALSAATFALCLSLVNLGPCSYAQLAAFSLPRRVSATDMFLPRTKAPFFSKFPKVRGSRFSGILKPAASIARTRTASGHKGFHALTPSSVTIPTCTGLGRMASRHRLRRRLLPRRIPFRWPSYRSRILKHPQTSSILVCAGAHSPIWGFRCRFLYARSATWSWSQFWQR